MISAHSADGCTCAGVGRAAPDRPSDCDETCSVNRKKRRAAFVLRLFEEPLCATQVCEKEVGKAHPTYIKFKKCLVHVESKLKEQRDKQSRAGIGAFFEGGRPFGAKA